MISREMFTWFDSSIAKQWKLIYAMQGILYNGRLSDQYFTK